MEQQEITLKLYDKQIKKLKQIADYSQRSVDEVLSDIIQTFCFMPTIVTGDLEDYCIQQVEKYENLDKSRQSTLTQERIKYFNRIRYFADQVYMSQTDLIKKIEEGN